MACPNFNHIQTSSPLVLAIDTSVKSTSIALGRGETPLAEFDGLISEERSVSLWDTIATLLQHTGNTVGDIDLYSAATGPGGFTGIRVGVAAIKGLAAARRKPIAAITSLELVAHLGRTAGQVCAVMNGYRGEVYWQIFSIDPHVTPAGSGLPESTDPESMMHRIGPVAAIIVGGDGADELSDQLRNLLESRKGLDARAQAPALIKIPGHRRASALIQLALRKYETGELQSAEDVKACYVRPAEAEIKLANGMLGRGMGMGLQRNPSGS